MLSSHLFSQNITIVLLSFCAFACSPQKTEPLYPYYAFGLRALSASLDVHQALNTSVWTLGCVEPSLHHGAKSVPIPKAISTYAQWYLYVCVFLEFYAVSYSLFFQHLHAIKKRVVNFMTG